MKLQNNILNRIQKSFESIEMWDMRVGSIFLHPLDFRLLQDCGTDFDPSGSRDIIDALSEQAEAHFVGFLYGAQVFHTWKVPRDHIGLIPSGWEVKIIDGSGCSPLPNLGEAVDKYDPFGRRVEPLTHEDVTCLTGEVSPLKVMIPDMVIEEVMEGVTRDPDADDVVSFLQRALSPPPICEPPKTPFQLVLDQIRDAYRQVRNGALKRSVWVREGASSYTLHSKEENK